VPADGGPARIETFEPEAEIVRWIFDAYVEKGRSIRQISFDLLDRGILSSAGKPIWGTSPITRLLSNEAYIGTVYYNRREHFDGGGARNRKTRSRERPRDEWIAIAVPAIVDRNTFDRVKQVSRDNSKWNPRGAEWGVWLLRGISSAVTVTSAATVTADEYVFAQARQARPSKATSANAPGSSTPPKPGCSNSTSSPAAPPRSPPAATNSPHEKNTLTRRSAELATGKRLRRRLARFAEQVVASRGSVPRGCERDRLHDNVMAWLRPPSGTSCVNNA
jgi:hypothetical protein